MLRDQLRGLARQWSLNDEETFRLLTVATELVTNVIEHARSPYRVTVRLTGSVLRVLVTDHSDAAPQLRPHGSDPVGRYGLRLVDELAAQWGWTLHRRGKTVWASIAHAH